MKKDYYVHWADFTAEKIIREKGDKESYTLASGITPSGVVHFGNFREVMTVDLVARALRDLGKEVRFVFSWDDFDTFRKVPANLPKQDELKTFLYQPIVDTPDPFDQAPSYAEYHEQSFEAQLEKVGVAFEPLYQAKKYRAGEYQKGIRKALEKTQEIKAILNQYRKEPLASDWLPVLVYCSQCNRDRIKKMSWDQKTLRYECELCQHQGEEQLATTQRVKLPWRVDWPMRWAFESVDFEPGGKDHSSEGGSFTTAKDIVKEIYQGEAPTYLQYDFVSVKGTGGKMSSSLGNLVTVNDVLKVFEPEIVRWIFASYKPNVDFSVSFDLDVIKTYEDFDRMERTAFGLEKANEKKLKMAKRVYELSQTQAPPTELPLQPSFRHLCNVLQIHDGDLEKLKSFYQLKNERDRRRLEQRARCAWHWIENYAPEDFKYKIHSSPINLSLEESEKTFFHKLQKSLQSEWESFQSDKDLHDKMYSFIHEVEVEPKAIFPKVYQKLIGRDRGPKLAGFIRTIGKEKVLQLLAND